MKIRMIILTVALCCSLCAVHNNVLANEKNSLPSQTTSSVSQQGTPSSSQQSAESVCGKICTTIIGLAVVPFAVAGYALFGGLPATWR